jgi:predicted pyridoxine 5'-phosphate oxidase superfamily flavin-nucleotide-binding protein
MIITSLPALRALYAEPNERARRKEITTLDVHCQRFIGLSPFVLLATSDAHHQLDASPRGGSPGFVKIAASGDLLIPDAPGNNRLDSLENIVTTGSVGLLFLIPGVDETLRVNGDAVLSQDPEDIAACTDERRAPKLGHPCGRARRLRALRESAHAVAALVGQQSDRSPHPAHHRRDVERSDRHLYTTGNTRSHGGAAYTGAVADRS